MEPASLFLALVLILVLEEAGKLLLEPGQPAAAVEQLLVTAGPGRMGFRVDVEMEDVALLAPGCAGRELAAIGHFDRNGVVFGMGILLHGFWSGFRRRIYPHAVGLSMQFRGSIQDGAWSDKPLLRLRGKGAEGNL